MWSSFLHFISWICNYAFSERGKAGKEACLRPYVFEFLCPWIPRVWEGKKRRGKGSPGQQSKGERDLSDPTLGQGWLPSKFGGGVCHACLSLWCRILDTGHAVLIQGSCGSSQAPVFSELITLSSSGNHATLCWPESPSSPFTFLCFQSLCRVPFLILSWERGLFPSKSAIPDLCFPRLYWAGGAVICGTLEGFLSYFLCYNSCVESDHEKL